HAAAGPPARSREVWSYCWSRSCSCRTRLRPKCIDAAKGPRDSVGTSGGFATGRSERPDIDDLAQPGLVAFEFARFVGDREVTQPFRQQRNQAGDEPAQDAQFP